MARTTRKAGKGGRVRYGVVGLGYISQVAVLPSFAHAGKNSQLVAFFSDDTEKLRKLGRKYGIDHLYGYDEYERGLEEAEVDAVYIALPNDLHREYTERAARAGVHVLCEKPMAVTVEDGQAMIEATRSAGVRLMIAYRLHFQKANLKAVEILQSGRLGQPRFFSSVFSMQVRDEDKGRKREQTFPKQDQFAPELLHFSECVLTGKEPAPSGREGLADVRVIQALYESARRGRPLALRDFDPGRRPEPEQEIRRPPVKEPELVKAGSPSGS